MSSTTNQFIGAGIEVAGVTFSVCGLNGMKYAVNLAQERNGRNKYPFLNLRWLSYLLVFGFGQGLEALTLYFATQSVMAASSNSALIANALVAAYVFGEEFRWLPDTSKQGLGVLIGWDLGSTCVLLLGTILTVVAAPLQPNELYDASFMEELFVSPAYLGFLISCILIIAGCSVLVLLDKRFRVRSNISALTFALIAASLASIVITTSKVTILLIKTTIDGSDQFDGPAPYLFGFFWGFTELLNLIALNIGLSINDALVVLPIYYCFMDIFTVAAGLTFFRTWGAFNGSLEGLVFSSGILICILGILLMSQRPPTRKRRGNPHQPLLHDEAGSHRESFATPDSELSVNGTPHSTSLSLHYPNDDSPQILNSEGRSSLTMVHTQGTG